MLYNKRFDIFLDLPGKLRFIRDLGVKYAVSSDIYGILPDWKTFIRSRYSKEPTAKMFIDSTPFQQEVFLKPEFFAKYGGDCDDQSIFFISQLPLLISKNYLPLDRYFLIILIDNNFSHVTQCNSYGLLDFLPYQVPSRAREIYRLRVL